MQYEHIKKVGCPHECRVLDQVPNSILENDFQANTDQNKPA